MKLLSFVPFVGWYKLLVELSSILSQSFLVTIHLIYVRLFELEVKGEEGEIRKEIGAWLLKAELRSLQTEKLRGLLDYLVLRLLKSQSMHGYGILCAVRELYGYYPAPSTLYPLLSSFEEKGYVESRFEFRNGRPIRVYSITSEGTVILYFVEELLNHVVSLADLKVRERI